MAVIDVILVEDLTPLFDVIYRDDVLWIAHAPRQDLEVLFQFTKKLPKLLFDTQIAAAFLNYQFQISYKALVKAIANVDIAKAHTRFNWLQRPLPDNAVQYAIDDVKYLFAIYENLKDNLSKEKKLIWFEEEMKYLLNENLYYINCSDAYKRVKGITNLDAESKKNAIYLAALREHKAQNENKPRMWIERDKSLIYRAINNKVDTKEIEYAKKKWPELNTVKISKKTYKPFNNIEIELKKKIQQIIIQKAKEYNLKSELIANIKNINSYVRGGKETAFSYGWRNKILKKELENAK